MNFFYWLREGVRQAVVLGVADACEDIGKQAKGGELGPALAASLRERLGAEPSPAGGLPGAVAENGGATRTRKRLGRSLAKPEQPLTKAA